MGGFGSGAKPNLQRREAVLRLFRSGMSRAAIAEKLGLNYRTVSLHLVNQGIRKRAAPDDVLTIDRILDWAREFYSLHGQYPMTRSGPIDGTRENWKAINTYLKRGGRGLPGGLSLRRLLQERLGATFPRKVRLVKPELSEQQILRWADEHRTRTGYWPRHDSGPVQGTTETWRNIDAALQTGRRGLPGGSSLAQLLNKRRRARLRTRVVWNEEEDRLLGTMPDAELAKKLGRGERAVRRRRRAK